MVTVQIIIFNGFDELDAIAPFEVLRTAKAMGADVQVELATVDSTEEIVAAHGLRIQPDAKLRIDGGLDILIVPGGGWGNRAAQGAWAEVQRGVIPAAISQLHHNGTTIASVCTGAMLVAGSGLLTGRSATTHHVAIDELRAIGAEVIDARVVDDGEIVTAGGVTSGLELTLWLLERYLSPQIACAVEKELEYERRGAVWRHSKTHLAP
jgi:transcriptional regulator GlxA family with amidase domain